MSALFDRVAAGPSVYGALGWDFGSSRTIGEGAGWCGASGARDTIQARFPCVLLKAIYLTESGWAQFCGSGRTVIARDCGYGIAQVTSGMRPGEHPAFDGARVASSAAYNVSVGAAILADKWRVSPCVGANDADIIEDWYFAVWGYNGFAFSNNPNNPMFRADRPEYRTPRVPSAQTRGNYPYQEIVWGYAHYPTTAAHYTGIGLAYPARSEICSSCGRPTADISEPMGSHYATCPGTAPPPPIDSGVRDTGVLVDVPSVDLPVVMDVRDTGAMADARDTGSVADVRDAGAMVDVSFLDVPSRADIAVTDVTDVPASTDNTPIVLDVMGTDVTEESGVQFIDEPAGCGCRIPLRSATSSGVWWLIAMGICARRARRVTTGKPR